MSNKRSLKALTLLLSITLAIGFIAFRAGAFDDTPPVQQAGPAVLAGTKSRLVFDSELVFQQPKQTMSGSKFMIVDWTPLGEMKAEVPSSATMTGDPLPFYPQVQPYPLFVIDKPLIMPKSEPPVYTLSYSYPTVMLGSKSGSIFPPLRPLPLVKPMQVFPDNPYYYPEYRLPPGQLLHVPGPP